jgi:RES domain-containing protein
MARAWRLFKAKHARTAFTGEGARRFGGRWNHKGTRVVYASENGALAVLETLVHLEPAEMTQRFMLTCCHFDDSLVKVLSFRDLPNGWWRNSARDALRQIGTDWVASAESPILAVPSAIMKFEFNYLMNPQHTDFARITFDQAIPFQLDMRLLKNMPLA